MEPQYNWPQAEASYSRLETNFFTLIFENNMSNIDVPTLLNKSAPADADLFYIADALGGGNWDDKHVTFAQLKAILGALARDNTWTGNNEFSSPIAVGIPLSAGHAARKDYVDTGLGSKENVANKSSSFTTSSTTTYPNTKALVDGLAIKKNIAADYLVVARSPGQTVNAASATKINYSDSLSGGIDRNNNWDNSLSRFVAPVSGFYVGAASVYCSPGASSSFVMYITTNSSSSGIVAIGSEFQIPSTGPLSDSISIGLWLNAGQRIEVFCFTSAARTLVADYTRFTLTLSAT